MILSKQKRNWLNYRLKSHRIAGAHHHPKPERGIKHKGMDTYWRHMASSHRLDSRCGSVEDSHPKYQGFRDVEVVVLGGGILRQA